MLTSLPVLFLCRAVYLKLYGNFLNILLSSFLVYLDRYICFLNPLTPNPPPIITQHFSHFTLKPIPPNFPFLNVLLIINPFHTNHSQNIQKPTSNYPFLFPIPSTSHFSLHPLPSLYPPLIPLINLHPHLLNPLQQPPHYQYLHFPNSPPPPRPTPINPIPPIQYPSHLISYSPYTPPINSTQPRPSPLPPFNSIRSHKLPSNSPPPPRATHHPLRYPPPLAPPPCPPSPTSPPLSSLGAPPQAPTLHTGAHRIHSPPLPNPLLPPPAQPPRDP
jgi:hypothetical protein